MSEKTAKWREELQELSLQDSPAVRQANGVWRVVDREKAWKEAGPRIFDEHLERFQKVAIAILGERDPKFELPHEDRSFATVHGKRMEHSSIIRKGVAETLALLGSRPEALSSASEGKAQLVACLVVRELLSPADPVLWATLNDVLPLLSEAAPDEFLSNCESSLASDSKPFEFLFGEEETGVFGATYMSGLLWALENLAWGSDYLARVALVLSALAAIDPGGNWGNRPSASLFTIFCPWLPQTCASVEKRIAAVTAIQTDFPCIGWALLLELLPSSHQSSSGSHKPKWRKLIPDDWPENPTNEDYWKQVTAYAALSVKLAKEDLVRLADLIPRIPKLPGEARTSLLDHLTSDAVTNFPEDERTRIWNVLQELITQHRKYSDADWAMPPSAVKDLENRADALKPKAPVNEHKRLFTDNDFELMSDKGDYESQRQELENRRQIALKEIHDFGGFKEIFGMVGAVESPWRLGYTLGRLPELNEDSRILPETLISSDKDQISFAGGYVWGRYQTEGWPWVDSLPLASWPNNAKSKFYTFLPFCKDTWDRVANTLGDEAAGYWKNAGGNIYEAGDDAVLGIKLLIQHDRAHTAVRGLQSLQHKTKDLDPELAFLALESALKTHEDLNRLDTHATVEIITALQKLQSVDQERLSIVEWGYLPLLGRYSRGSPRTLEKKLALDPEFYCEVIRMVFRARGEAPPEEEPTERAKNMAQNAYKLLHDWHIPPGSLPDGTFDSDHFVTWIDKVKEIAGASGHLKVALQRIGHVLFYSQKFADELWLPDSVARVLNQPDNEEIRRGLTLECFNSRGVHGFTHGKEELEIAAGYRSKAEAFELAGFPRLAVALRGIAETYERDAEREAKRNPYED